MALQYNLTDAIVKQALMRRHAARHWVLLVDPDEFLVFPYVDRRNLKELTNFLDSGLDSGSDMIVPVYPVWKNRKRNRC